MSYLYYLILVPKGEESPLILPTLPTLSVLSTLYYHQPTGGEWHGLDNYLAENELPPKSADTSALYRIRAISPLAISRSIGAIRTPTIITRPAEYAFKAVLGTVAMVDPYSVGRIALMRRVD